MVRDLACNIWYSTVAPLFLPCTRLRARLCNLLFTILPWNRSSTTTDDSVPGEKIYYPYV